MMKTYVLHGFLGKPEDWKGLNQGMFLNGGLEAVDLYNFPIISLEEWAEQFNRYVQDDSAGCNRCLIGYSLGGRLALHSLLQNPFLWDAAILISAHCGLESAVKKQERCLADERWARLFEQEEWSALLSAWNSQPVFQDSQELPDRREADFSRKNLASTLRYSLLGNRKLCEKKLLSCRYLYYGWLEKRTRHSCSWQKRCN